jgi:hypothetical protein
MSIYELKAKIPEPTKSADSTPYTLVPVSVGDPGSLDSSMRGFTTIVSPHLLPPGVLHQPTILAMIIDLLPFEIRLKGLRSINNLAIVSLLYNLVTTTLKA